MTIAGSPPLPQEWDLRTLASIARVSTGTSKSSGGHRFIVLDMGSVDRLGNLVAKKQTDDPSDILQVGELVMPKDDIGGGNIIGKVVIVDQEARYVLGDHVYRLSVFSGHPAFVRYAINSDLVNASLRRQVVGSAQLGLPRRAVEEQVIPFPELDEQRAIAAALSDASAWVESLDALIAKKRDVFEGMRQMLLTGTQRLPGFHENWGELRLCDIGSFGGGCGFPTRMQGGSSGIPFYKVSDMNTGGNETIMRVARNYVTEQEAKALGANVYLPGSVIFAKVGAAIFLERKRILSEPSCIDNNMMALTPNAKLMDTSYLHLLLSLVKLSAHSASTALPALNAGVLAAITIRVPSLDEQHAIAAILLDASTEIDNLVAERDKAELIRQGMAQDLLTGKVRLV